MNDSLLLWAFNVVLQVTCVSGFALAIAMCVRKHATIRSWALGLALLLMLVCPFTAAVVQGLGRSLIAVDLSISVPSDQEMHAEPSEPVAARWESAESAYIRAPSRPRNEPGAVAVADSTLSDELQRPASPTSLIGESGASPAPQRRDVAEASSALARAEPQIDGAPGAAAATAAAAWKRVAGMLVLVWLSGAALLLARLGVNCWRLRRILTSATPATNPQLTDVFSRACAELRVTHAPDLVLSGEVSGPYSAGWLRPRIVLPAQLADQVPAAQLHDIVVHEIAHVLRRDQWTVLFQQAAGAIYWFHPLVGRVNQWLAQSREEICDNYVLATTSAPAYSRTLLTIAELAAPRPLPCAVGLLTSRWKLENRVAGLLDDQRSRGVEPGSRAKALLAASALVIAIGVTLGTVTLAARQAPDDAAQSGQSSSPESQPGSQSGDIENALLNGPTLRGEGDHREMLLRGRVYDVDGQPAHGFELVARKVNQGRSVRDVLTARVQGNEFEVWVPISGSDWRYVEMTATALNGASRAFTDLINRELRQAAIEGIDLRLAPANRTVEVSVTHDGMPVANAHVNVQLAGNLPFGGADSLEATTDQNGRSTFRLREDEQLHALTAWTDDFRIGGLLLRKPYGDPFGTDLTVELDDCRDQQVRLVNAEDNSPVANVPFVLTIGGGSPDYRFAAGPATFPHCRMTTDQNGEATCRWFPDWKTDGAYVAVIDPDWVTAVVNNVRGRVETATTAADGALVMPLKRRVARQSFSGKITSDRFDVGGLLVELRSFQAEVESQMDDVHAFTDKAGRFTADCIPGATYTVCVNDGRLLSDMIALIPYEPETSKRNTVELDVHEARPVEIRVTSGPRREPMLNQRVQVRQEHPYEWIKEDGKRRKGTGARDCVVYTDQHGVARARALGGSEVVITVWAEEWRSGERRVTVEDDGVTLVEIHREIDEEREVTGRLLAPPNVDAELAGAQVIFGSIDGNTGEREEIAADAQGRFTFKTKAIRLGIFASTTDGQAAGVAKPESFDAPVEIQLKPTMDLHGQFLGVNDEPLANRPVTVVLRVEGSRNPGWSFPPMLDARTLETRTDATGKYSVQNLPTEFDIDVYMWADRSDRLGEELYVPTFRLIAGEERPRNVTRLGPAIWDGDNRTLSEKYQEALQNAALGSYHVLVLSYDKASLDFVNLKVLDHEATPEVMSFLNLRIEKALPEYDDSRRFAELYRWPQPTEGKVFVCALNAIGRELGRIELDVSQADALAQAAAFIRKHAPPQADAQAKWDAAFAEAKRSGRRVWALIGQRYCEPCFVLSRWLDDNRELLERDYVLLTIDNVRDNHGEEVANRSGHFRAS